MNCRERRGPDGPLWMAGSPSTRMSTSTTDTLPLLHFTKNYEHRDSGSYSSVPDYMRPLRTTVDAPARKHTPKVRRITSWMLRHRRQPHRRLTDRTGQILVSCPHLAVTAGHVTSFAEMFAEHLGTQLNSWIPAARASLRPRTRHRPRTRLQRTDPAL